MKISEKISKFYMWFFGEEPVTLDINSEVNGIKRVAAGDPTVELAPIKNLDQLPKTLKTDTGETITITDFEPFEVVGSSMSPEDIDNGDILLSHPVTPDTASTFENGVFAIIKVDPDYYKAKNKELKFGFKLRYTLYSMPVNTSIDKLVSSIQDLTPSVALKKNRELLATKYNEATRFYTNRPLMLSLTYKDGVLRYSFHPVDLISNRAEYVLKHTPAGWYAKKI